MSKPVMLIIGTRPEGIKMLPVYFALKQKNIPVVICSTTQHTHLLTDVYRVFGVTPDIELNIMQPNQDLFHITTNVLQRVQSVLQQYRPTMVLVHGDTTSSMAAALAAFYVQIPIGHVEAGLRTFDMHNPFPEEMNRKFIDLVTDYHFAPTTRAANNIRKEMSNAQNVFFTGNTIVDALLLIKEKIESFHVATDPTITRQVTDCIRQNRKILLLTTHRRESFAGGIYNILNVMKKFALQNPEYQIFYPYHPNPHVLTAIEASGIKSCSSIYLHKPICYLDMVYLLLNADLVATDSGGIQEEAVSLGKSVIILREKTERPEGIEIGLAHLAGTHPTRIMTALKKCIHTSSAPTSAMPYGTGNAATRIANIIAQNYYASIRPPRLTQEKREHTV